MKRGPLPLLIVVTALSVGLVACAGSSSDDAGRPRTTIQREGVVVCARRPDGVAVSMPKFVGREVLSAAQLACDMGFTIDWAKEPLRMDRVVRTQDPQAGTPTLTGSTVRLTSVVPKRD
jgi:hypothetical protein